MSAGVRPRAPTGRRARVLVQYASRLDPLAAPGRTGDHLRPYREWLPATGYEGTASLGGSYVSERIEGYYFTPWDLGYGSYVGFDHDFVGREALEGLSDCEHRPKVTLALDHDDVTRTIGTMFRGTERGSSSTGRQPCMRCTSTTTSS